LAKTLNEQENVLCNFITKKYVAIYVYCSVTNELLIK